MKIPYRRSRKKTPSTISAKFEAQKIAFAPITFQAVHAMLNLGILKFLDAKNPTPATIQEITTHCNITEYAVSTLMEVGTEIEVVEKIKDGGYVITLLGQNFLHDEMTKVNMNFVQDVCYLGAKELEKSFVNQKPEGLKVFADGDTIYPHLSTLPDKSRKSWYEFDHFYSDNSFADVMPIIFKDNPKMIFDIGGNTGKFSLCCFEYNSDVEVTIIDLPEQIATSKQTMKTNGLLNRCHFYPVNILEKTSSIPQNADVIWMSQFLDCFSKDEIISILKKTLSAMGDETRLFILEPFWDCQAFPAAKYSLIHTSLYFTCMANGNSKMYSKQDMLDCIETSGLKLSRIHSNIGKNDYTLLECKK